VPSTPAPAAVRTVLPSTRVDRVATTTADGADEADDEIDDEADGDSGGGSGDDEATAQLARSAERASQERLRMVLSLRRHAFLIEMIETLQAEQARASEDEAIEMALARSLEEGHGSGGGGGGGSSGRSYSGSYSVQRGGDGGGGVSVALLEQVLPSVPFSDARGFLLHDEADADETDGADGGIECAVCLLNFADDDAVRLLPCVHVFHAHCIDSWFARKTACPTCKQPVALG